MQEHGASSASCLRCEQTRQQLGKGSSKDHVGMRCWCRGWLMDLSSSGTRRLQDASRAGEVFLKIPLQQGKPVSWSQIGKGFSNQPVCGSAGSSLAFFRERLLCLLQRWCRGTPATPWTRCLLQTPGREGCSSSTAGRVLRFCVCPLWQTLAIPAGLPRNSLSVPKNPLVVWEGR